MLSEEGRLRYAGNVDDLKESPEFNWLLRDSATQTCKRSKDGITNTKRKSEPSIVPAPDAVAATELTGELQVDAARQMGDSAVYKFYFGSAGWPTLIAFVFAIIIVTFCDTFPSRSQSLEFESCVY